MPDPGRIDKACIYRRRRQDILPFTKFDPDKIWDGIIMLQCGKIRYQHAFMIDMLCHSISGINCPYAIAFKGCCGREEMIVVRIISQRISALCMTLRHISTILLECIDIGQ